MRFVRVAPMAVGVSSMGAIYHFFQFSSRSQSLPQVDLMVQALEAKGERPLVLIAEKYIDRVGDLYDN